MRGKEGRRVPWKNIQILETNEEKGFPGQHSFGLEVCYSEHEGDIRKLKENTNFDFLTGAVHFIDGWAFSHLRQPWKPEEYDLQKLYSRYYELLWQLASSGLAINYGDPQVGMNPRMLAAMLKNGVPVLTASDAHIPENVGKLVGMMTETIEEAKRRQQREFEQQ